MVDVEISGALVPFLYYPGSHYSMITRNVYDSLLTKPRLNPISKSGIGVDGHPFEIDGVTYINLIKRTENEEKIMIENIKKILPRKLIYVFLALNRKKSLRSAFVTNLIIL